MYNLYFKISGQCLSTILQLKKKICGQEAFSLLGFIELESFEMCMSAFRHILVLIIKYVF